MGIVGRALRARLDGNGRFLVRTHRRQLRRLGLGPFLRWNWGLLDAWARDALARRRYVGLDEAQVRAFRKSDTVFVFGSGYSLNGITEAEWQAFGEHDTFGFSGFVHQRWVRCDYHLVRGWVEVPEGTLKWRRNAVEFADALASNPRFRETVLVLQGEYLALFCNRLTGYGLLPPGTRVFRYRSNRGAASYTRSLREGVYHGSGTLTDAVNVAYCLGWKRIVLVGVDLYDSRYFWLPPDQTLGLDPATGMLEPSATTTHGARFNEAHNTVRNGVVEELGAWAKGMEADGVSLSVYNPRSLLAQVMPVCGPGAPAARSA